MIRVGIATKKSKEYRFQVISIELLHSVTIDNNRHYVSIFSIREGSHPLTASTLEKISNASTLLLLVNQIEESSTLTSHF